MYFLRNLQLGPLSIHQHEGLHRNYSTITFRYRVILLIDWPVNNMTLSPTALKPLQCSLSNVQYKNRKYEFQGRSGSYYLNPSISWLKADISYPNWSYFGWKKMHPLYPDFRISPKKVVDLFSKLFRTSSNWLKYRQLFLFIGQFQPDFQWRFIMEPKISFFWRKLALFIFLNKGYIFFIRSNNSFSWKFTEEFRFWNQIAVLNMQLLILFMQYHTYKI